MATVTLENLRHSYMPNPSSDADWALKQLDVEWEDGGAYALLGPSGCGKTTLLNIISGLLTPTEGRVLFDGRDVTALPPDQRHIAQVFQFPVVYDTMTVRQNLAFPLRNRGIDESEIAPRVDQIADMLELTQSLDRRAARLTADEKQKISLGRGLVRSDVNVIMFDEPLTVIDPHLKWVLRSKMKELHKELTRTMIYVTHDQTEALTIADRVVVMDLGEVVQIGTPIELFEEPRHTFVGHFIGSPGMNVLDCEWQDGKPAIDGHQVAASNARAVTNGGDGQQTGRLQIGVRPEFVSFTARGGLPVDIVKVSDAGRYRVVDTRLGQHIIKMLVDEDVEVAADKARIKFDTKMTRIYRDGWIVE